MKTLLLSSLCLLATSCSQLPMGGTTTAEVFKPNPPNVSVEGVVLVKAPSNLTLAAYYCPDYLNSFACRVIAPRPPIEDLRFSFEVALKVENPNKIAIPAVEALVAFKAYPQSSSEANFGAACIAICEEGTICGPPGPQACSDAGVLKSKKDYLGAAANFLVQTAIGNTSPADLKFRMIEPGASIIVKAQFDISLQGMIALIKQLGGDVFDSIKKAKVPNFTIPIEVEGSVWLNVENFGKIGAGFGPIGDTWNLQ